MSAKILVIEDDEDINGLLCRLLAKHDYEAVGAFSGTEAKLRLSMENFDLILMDLMIPGIKGEDLLVQLRENQTMPVIVISAKVALEDKVSVLKLGADDYITKPFQNEEVLARVYSQLRRYHKYEPDNQKEKNRLTCKKVTLNVSSREVTVDSKLIGFTAHEFDILFLLMSHPDKVYSREMLYQEIWKAGYYGEDNTVNVHISNIRKKLEEADPESEYIKTVWGVGFKLAV